MHNKPYIKIYTDGACARNPGPGGWGALILCGSTKKEIFGYELDTTNNQMELQAAISALEILKVSCNIEIFTDSKYLQQSITSWIHGWYKNNWYKKDKRPVKNLQLWKKLYEQTQKHNIKWYWIKGHSNDKGNDIADGLAVKGKKLAMKNLNYVDNK